MFLNVHKTFNSTNSSLSEHLIQVSKYNCLQYFQGRIKDIV